MRSYRNVPATAVVPASVRPDTRHSRGRGNDEFQDGRQLVNGMKASRSLGGSHPARWASLALALALLQGCGRTRDNAAAIPDSLAPARGALTSNRAPDTLRALSRSERNDVAAHAISWDAPTVAGHLRGIGLVAEAKGIVTRPMFRVRGQRFEVSGGRAIVEAYFYGDANAVALDGDKLDTLQVMPKGGSMRWEKPARFIVDNNMAAVVLTDDAALRSTIEKALRSELRGSTQQK